MPWETPPSTVLSGNTLGVSRVFGSIATFVASDNVTLSGEPGRIVVMAAGGTGGAGGGVALAAGTQTATSGTVAFVNSNGIVFGMSASTRITGSYTVPVQTAFVLSEANGISFGTNGSTVTATVKTDYLTTARRSTDAIGLNTAQSNVTWTVNSSGLSLDARGYAGTATAATNAAITVNSNGVSISVAPAQTVQTVGLYAVSNTTGQSSSSTFDARTISFAGAGIASVGYSAGSVVVSVPAGGGAGDGGIFLSASASSVTAGTVVFSNSNNVSFGLNGSTVTATASFAGGAAQTVSSFAAYEVAGISTVTVNVGTATRATASFFPVTVDQYVAAGWLNLMGNFSFNTGQNNAASATHGVVYGLYSQGTGANSTTLSRITSGSFSIRATCNNSSFTINYPASTDSAGYTTSATNSAATNLVTLFTGMKLLQFPVQKTLSPGVYWLGLAGTGSTANQNCGLLMSWVGGGQTQTALAPLNKHTSDFTTGTAYTLQLGGGGPWAFGHGSFTSANQTDVPSTVALSNLTAGASFVPFMKFWST